MSAVEAATAPDRNGPPDSAAAAVDIDPKKRLEVLLDALKDAYKEMTEAVLKIMGVLLAVLAWFASKENPLPVLCHVPWLVPIALFFTALGVPGLLYLVSQVYRRAGRACCSLSSLGYDPMLFERYRVTKAMLGWALFGLFTMLVGIFFSIAGSYHWGRTETCKLLPASAASHPPPSRPSS